MGGQARLKHMLNLGGDQPNASISAKPTPPPRKPIRERAKPRPKKLAFVIAHLGPGGAQRVAVTAANALVSRGFDIHLIVVERKPPAYTIDPRVVLHHLRDTTAKRGTPSNVDRKRWFESGRVAARISPRALANFNEFTRMMVGPLFAAEALRRRALPLRKKIRVIDPDTVLSFLTQTNILTVVATRGLKKLIVISERNDPNRQRHRARVEFLRRLVYPWADVVTANT